MSTRALIASLALLGACCGTSPPAATPASKSVAAPAPAPTPAAPAPGPADDAPVAAMHAYDVVSPHGTRNDPYYWLRDDTRQKPEVLAYLAAENAYTAKRMAGVKQLEEQLFGEFRARIKEDDASVPTLEHGYWYYTRFETGKQYPIFARRKGAMTAAEQIVIDGNAEAANHPYFAIGGMQVSPNGRYAAYGEDTVGRNQFALRVKDLTTGKLLPDTATNIGGSIAWAGDNKTLFYVGKDPTTLRTDRVFRHALGGASEQIYKEDDGQYYVGVGNSKSEQYVMIVAESTTNSEYRLIDARRPATAPRVFLARSPDHLYDLEHVDGRFLMRTNAGGKNFRIVEVPAGAAGNRAAWKDVVAHRDDTLVERFVAYRGFIAASVRSGGLRKVLVLPRRGASFFLDAQDASYAMSVIDTPGADSAVVRYSYDSMTTPSSVFELDLRTKAKKLLKQQPVPGYDPAKYTTAYLHATAKDGTKIPISLVHATSTKLDGSAPLVVFGYGSYGSSMTPSLVSERVSLLDRGFVYALVHIRGGQELGRSWYEDGKLLKKMNTFTDFIAATEYLVAEKVGARDQVFARGGSAGGLLMGAIANLRPDLYKGIVAQVPFVDVVTTMLDESIPLTTNEFDEWGNPKDKASYDYMLAYSPYDNVRAQAYPAMYVKTGLHDSQVQYYEPAKWVAKLRRMKTDRNLIVLDVDLTSGHGGASGRFDRLRQAAREMAFILMVRDLPDARAAR